MLSKKTIGSLLKIGIVAFALFFLYEQLTSKSSVEQFNGDVILQQIKEGYAVLVAVALMMFLNWLLEAVKWRFLILKIEQISIKRSIRAIFSGITVSAFTPNRVGEYGGRVFCLEKADRIQAVLITVIGSMAQLVTTIFFGCVGLLFLPKYKPEFYNIVNSIEFGYPILVFLLVLLNVLIVFLFLNASLFSAILSKIKFLSKYKKYNEVFSFYNTGELVKVLLYSVARYAVFTTQFFILLLLFKVDIAYADAIVLIMIMLFIVSIIPTLAITEIGIRGPVAIFLFGLPTPEIDMTVQIFSATFVMWIINLLLPALIGTVFIFTLKFFRK
ncbi:MAG: lysylphosphatidylglycerol synthase domain-containing protein [Bacteroidota bacterium]|nr:lysylphosphatidylglycerol synthase domain-containing protein [Bacteroidota bacterium]